MYPCVWGFRVLSTTSTIALLTHVLQQKACQCVQGQSTWFLQQVPSTIGQGLTSQGTWLQNRQATNQQLENANCYLLLISTNLQVINSSANILFISKQTKTIIGSNSFVDVFLLSSFFSNWLFLLLSIMELKAGKLNIFFKV